MFTMNPSQGQVRRTTDLISEKNFGMRSKDNGSKEAQFHGILTEQALFDALLFGLETKEKKHDGFDGGFDIFFAGLRIDIKTQIRSSATKPKPYYSNNVCAHQFEYDCDAYIFCSIYKVNNEITVCGWIPKTKAKRVAMWFPKGTERQQANGNTMTLKMDTFEIKNSDLYDVGSAKDLAEQLLSWGAI